MAWNSPQLFAAVGGEFGKAGLRGEHLSRGVEEFEIGNQPDAVAQIRLDIPEPDGPGIDGERLALGEDGLTARRVAAETGDLAIDEGGGGQRQGRLRPGGIKTLIGGGERFGKGGGDGLLRGGRPRDCRKGERGGKRAGACKA